MNENLILENIDYFKSRCSEKDLSFSFILIRNGTQTSEFYGGGLCRQLLVMEWVIFNTNTYIALLRENENIRALLAQSGSL